MEMQYYKILSNLLEEKEQGRDIEEIMSSSDGLSKEELDELKECDDLLISFNKKYLQLESASRNGYSRTEWLEEQLEGYSEEVVDRITEIAKDTSNNEVYE